MALVRIREAVARLFELGQMCVGARPGAVEGGVSFGRGGAVAGTGAGAGHAEERGGAVGLACEGRGELARATSMGSLEEAMGLWRESAAYEREEEAERIGELFGPGYAEDRGQMTPERRAHPLELFRLEVVRGDYSRLDVLRAYDGENGGAPVRIIRLSDGRHGIKALAGFFKSRRSVLTAARRPRPSSSI